MMTIIATVLGFLGPFVPELIKWFNRKQDNAHELEMMRLQIEANKDAHVHRLEALNVQGDIAEMQTLRQPAQSFGVQLLDAAKGWPTWVILPVFWAFALLDWLNGTVRPVVTYWVVGFWIVYKWSLFQLASQGKAWEVGVVAVWTPDDAAILMLCLSYFFGQRAAKAAFGGSASTGKPMAG